MPLHRLIHVFGFMYFWKLKAGGCLIFRFYCILMWQFLKFSFFSGSQREGDQNPTLVPRGGSNVHPSCSPPTIMHVCTEFWICWLFNKKKVVSKGLIIYPRLIILPFSLQPWFNKVHFLNLWYSCLSIHHLPLTVSSSHFVQLLVNYLFITQLKNLVSSFFMI